MSGLTTKVNSDIAQKRFGIPTLNGEVIGSGKGDRRCASPGLAEEIILGKAR